jgi:DNA-binding MarR family transcriptional regulator
MAQVRSRGRRSGESAPTSSAAAEDIYLGPLTDLIGFHLRLAQSASSQAFAQRLDSIDVSPSWFAVLALIRENPGITQTALSRADARDKSSLTRVLDDLERREFVTRERHQSNRRSYSLKLTTAGMNLLDELMEHARAHEHDLERAVGFPQKFDLICALQRITMQFV